MRPGVPGSRGRGWLFRASPQGDVLWERYYSDSLQRPWAPRMQFIDMCEMDDGRIAATGIAYDKNDQGWINPNILLVVLDENGCLELGCDQTHYYLTSGVKTVFSLPPLPFLHVWPNPAAEAFRVQVPGSVWTGKNDLTLAAYDVQGRETYNTMVSEEQPTVDASKWPNDAGTAHTSQLSAPPH